MSSGCLVGRLENTLSWLVSTVRRLQILSPKLVSVQLKKIKKIKKNSTKNPKFKTWSIESRKIFKLALQFCTCVEYLPAALAKFAEQTNCSFLHL